MLLYIFLSFLGYAKPDPVSEVLHHRIGRSYQKRSFSLQTQLFVTVAAPETCHSTDWCGGGRREYALICKAQASFRITVRFWYV
jgi:hypothetical protein